MGEVDGEREEGAHYSPNQIDLLFHVQTLLDFPHFLRSTGRTESIDDMNYGYGFKKAVYFSWSRSIMYHTVFIYLCIYLCIGM
jgi:hypothetical protein